MLGIVSRNVSALQPLSPPFFRSLSTKKIDLSTTRFADVKHIVSRPEDFVIGKARPFCLAMKHLQKDLLVPHLKAKVDLIGGSYDETSWLLPDQRLLRDCESLVLRDASLDPIRPFLLELIRGMLTHSQHRPDILELNAGRVIPENGPLIREMYILAERASIQESSNLLKSFLSNDSLTDAFLRSDIRRLIRNIVRVGATQQNAKLAARQSLISAMATFSEEYSKPLSELGFLPLLQTKHRTESERDQIEEDIHTLARDVFSSQIINPSPELVTWLDDQFQGFSFKDLVKKYMNQGKTIQKTLEIISKNASKDNPSVTTKMAIAPRTKVTKAYESAMISYTLFRPAFFEGSILKHDVVHLD